MVSHRKVQRTACSTCLVEWGTRASRFGPNLAERLLHDAGELADCFDLLDFREVKDFLPPKPEVIIAETESNSACHRVGPQ